jgi:hypothetical protein
MVNKNDSKCKQVLNNHIDVDDLGNVTYKNSGKKVSTRPSPSGYVRAEFSYNKEKYRLLVHRLVMIKFHGSQPLEVDHINKDRLDNRLSNLRYVTRSENCKGKIVKCERVLSDEDCIEMRSLYKEGWSKGALARHYNISQIVVSIRLIEDYKLPARIYHLLDPEKNEVTVTNLNDLVRKYNLCASPLSRLCLGRIKNYKGWTLNSPPHEMNPTSMKRVIHFVGDKSLCEYCLENDLNYDAEINKIRRGKTPKGYYKKESK